MRQTTNRQVYLFGNTLEHFPTNKLPSYQQVFQRFYFIHSIEKQSIKESAKKATRELIHIWSVLANLPTKDEDEVSRMIIKYFNEWNKLRMNEHYILTGKEHSRAVAEKDERALLKSYNQQEKKRHFQTNFNDLFDIAPGNPLQKMSLQEDIDFYLSQKRPGRPGQISNSIDRSYSMLLDCSLSDIEEDMDCN